MPSLALAELRRDGRTFDLVIVDPPAFAKREGELSAALTPTSVSPPWRWVCCGRGGTLVMASCSSRVPAAAFFDAVNAAARRAGRPLRESERTGHPIDHPVMFPEGAYLKCLFATVP